MVPMIGLHYRRSIRVCNHSPPDRHLSRYSKFRLPAASQVPIRLPYSTISCSCRLSCTAFFISSNAAFRSAGCRRCSPGNRRALIFTLVEAPDADEHEAYLCSSLLGGVLVPLPAHVCLHRRIALRHQDVLARPHIRSAITVSAPTHRREHTPRKPTFRHHHQLHYHKARDSPHLLPIDQFAKNPTLVISFPVTRYTQSHSLTHSPCS